MFVCFLLINIYIISFFQYAQCLSQYTEFTKVNECIHSFKVTG